MCHSAWTRVLLCWHVAPVHTGAHNGLSRRHEDRREKVTQQGTVIETLQLLEESLRTHDRERIIGGILSAVEQGLPIEDLYSLVLEPFLASVGRGWQEGRTAVWEEHLAVGAVRAAIDALYPRVLARKQRVEPVPVTVAFFCPPLETHDLGLRMLADRFDLRGFRTVYVGALTPVAEMIACARAVGADVVCLSASTHYQRAALTSVVETLRQELPDVRIAAGGPAFAHTENGWEEYLVGSVEIFLDELSAGPLSEPKPAAPAPGSSDA